MQKFPALLSALHLLEFDYADGEGIDFEPYDEFLAPDEVTDWFRAWTGNSELNGDEYLVFGQDGCGGYAAIWRIRPAKDLLEQPVAYFGSEGELGVVASNFSDYLWLLASGYGPCEAVAYPDEQRTANELFTRLANQYATTPQRSIQQILAQANAEFPEFVNQIQDLCR